MAPKKKTKTWTYSTGHRPHMTGGGFHDSRPRGQRDRHNSKRAAIDKSLRDSSLEADLRAGRLLAEAGMADRVYVDVVELARNLGFEVCTGPGPTTLTPGWLVVCNGLSPLAMRMSVARVLCRWARATCDDAIVDDLAGGEREALVLLTPLPALLSMLDARERPARIARSFGVPLTWLQRRMVRLGKPYSSMVARA